MTVRFESLAKIADHALTPPVINTRPRPQYTAETMSYGMTLSVERTAGGRLWAAWVGGGDNEKAYAVLASSDDGGETWSAPRMVIDPHDKALPLARRTIVGVLWCDPAGRLWFFFDQAMSYYDGRAGIWATRCDDPDADEPRWLPARRLWHGCSLNKPIVLKSGKWILPASLWDREKIHSPFTENFHELDEYRGANVLESADMGETWAWKGGVAFPSPDFDEINLVEMEDGRIWMTARTRELGVWESFSDDGGASWTEPRETQIKNVNSRHFLRRLPSGNLLLVKHGRLAGRRTEMQIDAETGREKPYTGRSELTAFLSDDEGVSWKGGLVLDERIPVTYPDGCFAPDGTIWVSYDFAREDLGLILLARFREEDVLRGKMESPGAACKLVIFRPLKEKGE